MGKLRTQRRFLDLDLRTATTAGYTAGVLKCNLSGLIKKYLWFVFWVFFLINFFYKYIFCFSLLKKKTNQKSQGLGHKPGILQEIG